MILLMLLLTMINIFITYENTYFLDTSYILALEIKTDINYQIVLQSWLNLAISQPIIILIKNLKIYDEKS